jgi:hypothetical protein
MRRSNLLIGLWVIFLCGPSTASAAKVLFFQDSNAAWAPDMDEPFIEFLTSLGHQVTPYNTAEFNDPDEQIALAESHDVVYITESLSSASTTDGVETYIKNVDTPQIWAEAFAFDNAAMTADVIHEDFGNTQRVEPPVEELQLGQDSINIIANGHPLAAGFTGSVKVWEDEYSLNFGFRETMGSGATVIATVPDADAYATYFVYEKGSQLEDGTASAGMRIGMWIGQAGTGSPRFDNITANGRKFIEAAINYATGNIVTTPGDFNGDNRVDVTDIDLLSAAVRTQSTEAKFDVNKDGSINAADRGSWIRDIKKTYVGDSNLDGEFSSTDFVVVFTAGQYEDAIAGNSTWGTGDWNGDGEFNSGDFVDAFTEGGYEKGPRPSVSAVPEPGAALMLFLGVALLVGYRRR